MSLCILLCHAQVPFNCVDSFIICLNKKNNLRGCFHACSVQKLMLLFFTTRMPTAEAWAQLQFAACSPQRLVKSDVICCAACIMHRTEPLEDHISGLGHGEIHHLQRAWTRPSRSCSGGFAQTACGLNLNNRFYLRSSIT